MSPILYYCLKVILCSTILYGYYWFMLRNKIYHRYNRFYLLSVMLLSITLPLIKFTIGATEQANTGIIKLLTTVNGNGEYLDEVIVYSGRNIFNWKTVSIVLFALVSFAILISLVNALVHIYRLKKNNPLQEIEDIKLINTRDKSTPFSFFKNIFWNEEINVNTANGQRILKHELAHVTEYHSVDKLALNILLIFVWWNPIFWLLRKELNLIHEFIADKKAVEDGDTAAFAEMILAATYPRHQFNITNNFFYSPIKRRLIMLQKKNKTSISYISRILVLPLAALVFLAFTIKADKNIAPIKLDKKIVVVIDAGHGGTDAGAVGFDGSKEKDISLQLALKIQALNTNKNIEIILTRSTDILQTPKERAEFANSKNPNLFISIHVDASSRTLPPKTGMSVFVARNGSANVEESKLLASATLQSFKNNYGIDVPDTIAQRQVGIWVLQTSKAPAILIEAGFIDNKKDISLMKSEAGQTQFAKNVLNAIEMYAGNKGSAFYRNEKMPEVVTVSLAKQNDNGSIKDNSSGTNFKMGTKGNEELKKVLIIIDGKETTYNDVKWKSLHVNTISIYKKNNPEMIAKYGQKASDGVWVFNGDKTDYSQENKGDFTQVIADSFFIMDDSRATQNAAINTRTIPNNVLYVLNGVVVNAETVSKISGENIKKINVLKGDSGIKKYGEKGKDGVIEITLKNNDHEIQALQDTMKDKIFTKVDQEASFPGEQDAWRKYLQNNLNANVPVDAGMKPGTYTVITKFIVNTQGEISNISSETYNGTKMAEECIRVIKLGPKWIPAKQNGKIVNAYRRQPITFVVQQ